MTKKRTTRYLLVSLIVVVSVCVLVFAIIGYYYNVRSAETIRQVSQIYMSRMNERLKSHFETAVDYCLSRLEGVIAEAPPDAYRTFDEADKALTSAGLPAGFSALALMGNDGLLETVYGGNLSVLYPNHTFNILSQGKAYVGIGMLESEQAEVCCVPASYPMSDGERSVAVLGVLSGNFMSNLLTLDVPGALVSSYIIRPDGSYVLTSEAYGDNFYTDLEKGETPESEEDTEKFIKDLSAALEEGNTFDGAYTSSGRRVEVLATPLAYSQWYLLSEMPEGALTNAVSMLGQEGMWLVFAGCAALLVCLGAVFMRYYRMASAQLEEIERARAEAERANKAKSEFFSNMSHDIRTPMNAIVGMTAIAMSRIDSKEAVMNSLEKIALSSKQLLGLINDVLDMSRIESGKLTLHMDLMSLREFMDSVVAIIQPQVAVRRQEFDVYVDNVSVENVYCDTVRLNQVLLNLLANAVKFTQEGGKIMLAMSQSPSPLGAKYVRVNIDVSDNGIGMSEEFQKKVYETFAREETERVQSTEGVGLGMAITKYIIDAMNGTIELSSAPGKGSRFHIEIDLMKADAPEVEMSLPPLRILVIDDDVQVGEGACSTLESLGAHAEAVLDGESGLRMVERQREEGKPYDVILIDWKLPLMNGVQTARRIRELMGDEITILLMSAYEWADVEAEAVQAGISGFLAKPLFKSTLYHGLQSVFEQLPDREEKKKKDFSGKRLLIAEDNDINWEIMEDLLGQYNIQVERASDGEEAVNKFAMSPNNYYSGILMDVQMPVLNGLEATEQIRAMHENRDDAMLPIIAMTADAFAEDIRRSMEAGMNAHISKPVDLDELLHTLEKFLLKG